MAESVFTAGRQHHGAAERPRPFALVPDFAAASRLRRHRPRAGGSNGIAKLRWNLHGARPSTQNMNERATEILRPRLGRARRRGGRPCRRRGARRGHLPARRPGRGHRRRRENFTAAGARGSVAGPGPGAALTAEFIHNSERPSPVRRRAKIVLMSESPRLPTHRAPTTYCRSFTKF